MLSAPNHAVTGTILVADDQAANRELLDELLSTQGFKVITTPDGREALRRIEQVPVDLVLLDVMMPHLTGFQVCERIKSNPDTYLTPVIIITALSDKQDRIEGIKAGAEVRRDAFGDDIGQNSWLTASEHDKFQSWLKLSPGKSLLDVACGAGGPALRTATITGCSVLGIDVHEQAVATANTLAAERGMARVAEFRSMDATQQLPFSDGSFDAITCIDAINHFPDRPRIIAEWRRLLKPDGRLLFTDRIVMTGPLTNLEVAVRSARVSTCSPPVDTMKTSLCSVACESSG